MNHIVCGLFFIAPTLHPQSPTQTMPENAYVKCGIWKLSHAQLMR